VSNLPGYTCGRNLGRQRIGCRFCGDATRVPKSKRTAACLEAVGRVSPCAPPWPARTRWLAGAARRGLRALPVADLPWRWRSPSQSESVRVGPTFGKLKREGIREEWVRIDEWCSSRVWPANDGGGRARLSVRAAVARPDALVGRRGAQRTARPTNCGFAMALAESESVRVGPTFEPLEPLKRVG